MEVICKHCKRAYKPEKFENGRTFHCACGHRVHGQRFIRSQAHRSPFMFYADAMLGKLACYLRLLGFDTLWDRFVADDVLVATAFEQERIILTRDKALTQSYNATDIILIHSDKPTEQLKEVARFYPIKPTALPFARCSRCNIEVQPADVEQIADRVPLQVAQNHTSFWECPMCERVYWEGSHIASLYQLFEKLG